MLFKFYFLTSIDNVIKLSTDKDLINEIARKPSNEEDEFIVTSVENQEDMVGEITEIDIELGNSKVKLGAAFQELSNLITGEQDPDDAFSVDRTPEVEALDENAVH